MVGGRLPGEVKERALRRGGKKDGEQKAVLKDVIKNKLSIFVANQIQMANNQLHIMQCFNMISYGGCACFNKLLNMQYMFESFDISYEPARAFLFHF